MLQAWKEFKKCKNKKTDVAEFEFNLENNLFFLHQELINKTYKPEKYQAFYVYDPKRRHIHKAVVRDRVLNQAVFRILYNIFDKHFIFHSYSSRIKKGTHKASKKLFIALQKESKNWKQPVFVLKCDIKKFFDCIDHRILFELIKKRIFKKLIKAQKELLAGKINKEEFQQILVSYMGVLKHCRSNEIKREIRKRIVAFKI